MYFFGLLALIWLLLLAVSIPVFISSLFSGKEMDGCLGFVLGTTVFAGVCMWLITLVPV